ncbi:50S ribosomal protein L35 [Agrococcus carbonis]|jgi:large subunit ribosomal protein L35|uniref:Large ribosomal subunit protein bL35 n=1 Tax=Agrococcus carbonis TaxID=684552 RepID=A0A1H1SMG7_9MICO|nr:50S ribosomal protein L35 [Agrococcus carbonis]SDS48579.1 LSU ribosomal protein L35P [Agrococcus carbonis]
MPKQKTHSGAKKRFKVTGSGKIRKQQAGMRHNLEVKSSVQTRRLNKDKVLAPADAKTIKKLLAR